MTQILVIGIDPGLSGGLAAIADGELVKLRDMPTTTRIVRKRSAKDGKMHDRKKRSVNGHGISEFIREAVHAHPGAVVFGYLELAGARPGQAAGATLKTGYQAGIAEGVLCGHGIVVHIVSPMKWRRHFELPPRDKAETPAQAKVRMKRESCELAAKLHPNSGGVIVRAKDDGRAEAILLAELGYREASA